jgi:hypothetical protein
LRYRHEREVGAADAPFRARPRVRASALVLGGFGLLFTLVALDEGVDSLLLGAFLLGLGSVLWWGRRVGYLIGLVGDLIPS